MAMFMLAVILSSALVLAFVRAKITVALSVASLPLLILVVAWSAKVENGSSQPLLPFLQAYYQNEFFGSLTRRVLLPLFDFALIGESRVAAYGAAGMLALPFIVLAGYALRSGAKRFRKVLNFPEYVPIVVYAFGATVAWFVLPPDLPSQAFVYQRFGILANIGLLILFGSTVSFEVLRSVAFRFVAACAFLTFLVTSGAYYRDWNQETDALSPSVFPKEPASRLGAVICSPMFRNTPLFLHVGNYFTVWSKGITATPVIDYRFGSLRRAAPETKLPSALPWYCSQQPYQNEFAELELLFVKADKNDFSTIAPADGKLVTSTGPWALFRQ
jgi:hypothetical protein